MNRPWGTYRPNRWQKLLINLCRNTPLGRGRARRFVRDRLVYSRLDTVDFEFPFAKFRLSLTGNACEWKLLLNSGYNRKEFRFIREELLKQPQGARVFVDIGANIGMHTLAVHEYCDRIVAIEPLAEARERLEFNVSVNNAHDRITIIPFAISSKNHDVLLCRDINDLGGSHITEEEGKHTRPVQAKTLETILNEYNVGSVTCIKIDIEGYEDRALIPFFNKAPEKLFPQSMIIEHLSRSRWEQDCIGHLLESRYDYVCETRNNTFLRLKNRKNPNRNESQPGSHV